MDKEQRLETLLYNAIGYMLETNFDLDESFDLPEVAGEIANYLGSSVEELIDLKVLDKNIVNRVEDEYFDYEEEASFEEDSRGCKDCPEDECTGHCMSCPYRPV